MRWNNLFLLATITAIVFTTGCNTGPSNTITDSPEPLGKRIFEENCAGCHGTNGHGNPMMLQGKAVNFDDPTFQKMLSDATIENTIKNGRGMMPSFDKSFSDTEMKELISYLRSLSSQKKAQH